MASLLSLGRVVQECNNARSLIHPVIRCMSGTRSREGSSRLLPKISHTEMSNFNNVNQLARIVLPSEKGETISKKTNESVPVTDEEKLDVPLFGKRKKRSNETIRHDKLYLQPTSLSKREYAQTWTDFQDKRSIPITEWGKRLSD